MYAQWWPREHARRNGWRSGYVHTPPSTRRRATFTTRPTSAPAYVTKPVLQSRGEAIHPAPPICRGAAKASVGPTAELFVGRAGGDALGRVLAQPIHIPGHP